MLWIWLVGGLVAAFALFMLIGILHLRHSIRVAEAAIERVTVAEVPGLRDECVRVFHSAFGETLDLDDYEGAAELLSGRLDDVQSLKDAFQKEGFYWHFVLPVGAFMGELMRVHLNAEWRESELGGLEIAIPFEDDVAQTFPFHKVIKQATAGDPGDVYAYLLASRQLDKITEHLAEGEAE